MTRVPHRSLRQAALAALALPLCLAALLALPAAAEAKSAKAMPTLRTVPGSSPNIGSAR